MTSPTVAAVLELTTSRDLTRWLVIDYFLVNVVGETIKRDTLLQFLFSELLTIAVSND